VAEWIASLPPSERDKQIRTIATTAKELAALEYDWNFLARPKQQEPVGDWLVWLILAGRGFGKLLAVDTPIPTPSGWSCIGDIVAGAEVFDESGRVCRVTATFDATPDVAYRLWFSDGTSVDACSEHQWVTWTHAERKAFLRSPYENTTRFPAEWPAWKLKRKLGHDLSESIVRAALSLAAKGFSARAIARELGCARQALVRHLAVGNYVARAPRIHDDAPGPSIRTTQDIVDTLTYGRRDDSNHCVPTCGPLALPAAVLPIDPYVLGAWLGDGTAKDGTFTAHEDDQPHLRAAIERGGYQTTALSDVQRVGTRGLYNGLRRAGLLNNKHVPSAYLRASAEQRLAMLRGFMDTDGTVSKSGHVEFSNTIRSLVEAVVELARSLGQKPVVSEDRSVLDGVDHGPLWRATWTPTIQVFALPRKASRVDARPTGRSLRNHHRMIVRAERIAPAPMRCLTVDGAHSMFLAGEGMIPTHNTRTGAEWVRRRVEQGARTIYIIGRTTADVRDVMVGGPSGILAVSPPNNRPKYEPSKRRLTWPNGAYAICFSADEPDQLRGPQADTIWADEVAAWRYPAAWDQAMLGLRSKTSGLRPKACVTTTPKPTPLIRRLIEDDFARGGHNVVTRGSSYENKTNLASSYFEGLRRYEGTRLGRQEIWAELLDDSPGALWKRPIIDSLRLVPGPDGKLVEPDYRRVVVAVDPAVSAHKANDVRDDSEDPSKNISNETGIIVCAIDAKGHGYVLDDLSGTYTPAEWAKRAIKAFDDHEADCVLAEVNQGGDLVVSNLKTHRRDLPIKAVRASRGKYTRAEPVSGLYEQGRVHHVGSFPLLEDQLCSWEPDSGADSPDRLDALVWGMSFLMVAKNPVAASGRSGGSSGGWVGNSTPFEQRPIG